MLLKIDRSRGLDEREKESGTENEYTWKGKKINRNGKWATRSVKEGF